MSGRAQDFARQVVDLEASGDVERFVSTVFADDAELLRPEAQQHLHGRPNAQAFWQQYLAHFDTVRSEFSRLVDTGELSVLEWRSSGRLRGGAEITYRGVSILDFDNEGRVHRFATYYDTAPFHASQQLEQEA